jgi:ubiquinone/menaquinone biosynthesis C-methylase UbiE
MRFEDWLLPNRIERRVFTFGIQPGMTVVDYGCGPGRTTVPFARHTGPRGKVYSVDVQELALDRVRSKIKEQDLQNIIPVLARGYRTDIPDHCTDMVCALDMFFGVKDPVALLVDIHRILKPGGVLILDDGYQSRSKTLEKLNRSGRFELAVENKVHLRCTPIGCVFIERKAGR